MTNPSEDLLRDVLGEKQILEAVRMRCVTALPARRRSRLPVWAAVAFVTCALLYLAIPRSPESPPADPVTLPKSDREPSGFVVRSRQLREHEVVHTRFPNGLPTKMRVRTSGFVARVIATQSVATISRDELLRKFESRPVALVRYEDGSERLLFLDRETMEVPELE